STLGTVKTFLGLSADRAYKRFYPAVDPLLSWSRYRGQLSPWFEREAAEGWTERVHDMIELLKRGDGIYQMMQVTGEEGVTMNDFITYQKSLFVDMVYLQQDAFDDVDASTPIERQKQTFGLVYDLVTRAYQFETKDSARDYFTRLTGLFKNLNYAREDSPDHADYLQQINELTNSIKDASVEQSIANGVVE
ncbi:MAG: V-type ATP synthase subunit A, partial [Halobacteria archaeon]|nr:V-type ATP synthase subunit A [Halobacteria archaeon]